MDTESEPTVRIPVRIHPDGSVTLLYDDKPLAELFTAGIGELTIPAIHLTDPRWHDLLNYPIKRTIANTDFILYYKIRVADAAAFLKIDRGLRDFCFEIPEDSPHGGGIFAQIVLREPLQIAAYGTKSARLLPCSCWLPGLDRNAISVNQAGTFLSQVFEPTRQSHTINVFRDIFLARAGEELIPLDVERKAAEAAAEQFVMDNLDNLDLQPGTTALVQLPLFPWL